jgi:hypothetical protein
MRKMHFYHHIIEINYTYTFIKYKRVFRFERLINKMSRNRILIFIFCFNICLIYSVKTYDDDLTSNGRGGSSPESMIKIGSRSSGNGPVRYQYMFDLLVKEDTDLTLKTYNNSRAIYWAWSLNNNNENIDSEILAANELNINNKPIIVYNVANPSIRENQTLVKMFKCEPNENECNQIQIKNMKENYLGTYSYQSLMPNTLDSLYIDYNITMIVTTSRILNQNGGENGAIEMKCSSTSTGNKDSSLASFCELDQEKQQLSVLANKQIEIECSVKLASKSKPKIDNLNFDLKFDDQNVICLNSKRNIELFKNNNQTEQQHYNNVYYYRLSRTCSIEFNQYEKRQSIDCELINLNQQQQQQSSSLPILNSNNYDLTNEKTSIKLDIQYAPIEQREQQPASSFFPSKASQILSTNNITLISGTNKIINFTCPFMANPEPIFYWRIKNVNISSSPILTSTQNDLDNQNINKQVVNSPSQSIKMQMTSSNEFSQMRRDYTLQVASLDTGLYTFECKSKVLGLVNHETQPIEFRLRIIRKNC